MKFRRTPQERIDKALARLLERDWNQHDAGMCMVEWAIDASDGSITVVATNRPRNT